MPRPPRFVPAQDLVPLARVERAILILRGRRVILDSDLAALYGASAKRLNEQVKRNAGARVWACRPAAPSSENTDGTAVVQLPPGPQSVSQGEEAND